MYKKVENSEQFPLLNALLKQKNRVRCRFHVPSHSAGTNSLKLYEYDFTELPGLDNLYNPKGVIADSLVQTAAFFKSEKSYYLVNGSSAGLAAAVCSLCRPGEKVLLGRNFHRSAVAGLIMSGAMPYFIPVEEYNPEIPLNVKIEKTLALMDADNYKALIITSPSYWGITPDLEVLCTAAHKRNVAVIVDEAHGGHFIFNKNFPASASSCDADIWVNSAHKTLGALTPGALLHLKGNKANIARLENALSILQTSSPSYPVMASLEMICKENTEWDGIIELAHYAAEKAQELKSFSLLKNVDLPHGFFKDPLRLVFILKKIKLDGFAIIKLLSEKFGIEVEMADSKYFVALLQSGHSKDDIDFLMKALNDIENDYCGENDYPGKSSFYAYQPEFALTPRKAIDSLWQEIDIRDACGRVSAATVSSFPPGIPALIPGEIISKEITGLIIEDFNRGCFFTGIKTNGDIKINVVAE